MRHILCLLLTLLVPATTRAGIVVFHNPNDFNAAIAGRTILVENFDGLAAGTTIASGASIGGITFTYNWGIELMRINNNNPTNSGANYLGATNGGSAGSAIDLSAPLNNFTMTPDVTTSALGLFIITADPALADDFELSGGGASVRLETPPLSMLGQSEVYFLGLVDDTGAAIPSFNLVANQNAFQLPYRVDGIVYAVPEPSSLVCLSIAMLAGLRRRSRVRLSTRR